jgi:comEA protein
MFNLTAEEKIALILVLSTFFLGLFIIHLKKNDKLQFLNFEGEHSINSNCSETPEALKKALKVSKEVNINTASQAELTLLPGIGDVIASRIIEYRRNNGNFNHLEDLMNVKGIGQKKIEKIEEYITF